ncbi:hypothetical protein Pmani_031181 [Petrolisthes manimaculis]|uniref:Uncharacterized protein n=1 Tax=Petrolisthes manimaculis TaxID=1843537 RepID=A0AAE1NVV8_9EUCA|nr:hypothetical protein Pmani_031181 [Petrolisthes manimaculis]
MDGKIRVSAPDASHPSGFALRNDVLVKLSMDEEGETTVLYKRKPSSVLIPATPKVTTANLVDTAETLLRIPAINSEETPESFRLSGMRTPAQPPSSTKRPRAQLSWLNPR